MIENLSYVAYSGASLMFAFIIMILTYVINVYPLYVMAGKANLKNKWIAWIPVINVFKLYNLAGISGWFALLTLIPVIGWIITIVVLYRVFSNFGLGIIGCILGIVFSFIGFWYLALSSRRFVADINPRYTEY